MPLSEDRELIQITKHAYKHLKAVVAAKKNSGVPRTGTSLASEAILSIPLPPIPQPTEASASKKRARKATEQPAQAA
jgi:hypothetical protein